MSMLTRIVLITLITLITRNIGNLDAIAPVITNFFCLNYALVNLTCFLLKVSGTLNFRPKFKFYNWQSSLLGFALNIGVMIWLNPL